MLRTFNAKHLVAITVSDKEQHEYYKYKPAKNFLFWKEPEAFKAIIVEYSREEILSDSNLMIIDNVVYYKPSVAFRFSNKSIRVVYFDTFEEAKQYGAQMRKEHIALRDQIHLND